MAFNYGRWRFSPTKWPSLAMVIFVVLTLWLGRWQTHRAEEKQFMQERLDALASGPAISLPSTLVAAAEYAQRTVEVRGEFLNEKTIFIDNRVYRKRPGYHVITPLRIDGGGLAVAINRGWIAADPRRDILPGIPSPKGIQTLRAVAVKPLDRAYELSPENPIGPVKQNIALDRLQNEWAVALQPIVLQQIGDTQDGLVRDWPRPDAGADSHSAYALQWYVMAVVGMLLWITLNLKKLHESER